MFDRYALSLKDQTRQAMRTVSAYTDAQDTTPPAPPALKGTLAGDTPRSLALVQPPKSVTS